MGESANISLSAELEAAFAWWRDAGVDCAFLDDAQDWLRVAETAEPPLGGVPAARPTGDTKRQPLSSENRGPRLLAETVPAIDVAALPQDLAAFAAWWLTEPSLDGGRVAGRVPARAADPAELMIIVPEPESEDGDRLLSGPQGRLLDAFLAAAGARPETTYVASAIPRHMPMADWAALAHRGLGAILRHHIELARPKRLVAFGNNVLSLLGNDLPNSGQILFPLHQGESSIPLLAATDLGVLLARPRAKARLWQQWLDWTGPDGTGAKLDGIVNT